MLYYALLFGLLFGVVQSLPEPLNLQARTRRTANTATAVNKYNGVESDFSVAWLRAHNDLRVLHGVSNLTWDTTLASGAAAWALTQAQAGTFNHDQGSFGENMYEGSASLSGFIATPAAATYDWYSEEWTKGYVYNNGLPPTNEAGHFTQVVWKATTKLGCGGATYQSGGFYNTLYVCRYTTAGNSQTAAAFNANVLPRPTGVAAPSSSQSLELTCHNQSPVCKYYGSYCDAFVFLKGICPVACSTCN